MEIVVILLLILLNGMLSMTEMVFVSSRKYRAQADERFLSTIQIGITLISILTGLISGESFGAAFAQWLSQWGWLSASAHWVAKVLIVVAVTYVTLVIGELVPKRIGMAVPDKVARAMAGFMKFMRTLAMPFVWVLAQSTKGLMHLMGMGNLADTKVTEKEVIDLVEEGMEDGEIDEVEQELVGRIFNLGDRSVDTIMTHRSELVWLDLTESNAENLQIVKDNPHGIYPVANQQLDDIRGVVFMKDLFDRMGHPQFKLASVVQRPMFLPENVSVYAALEQLRNQYSKYALIIDEFGGIQGMVTHSDVMEALIGELPENKEDHDIVDREDGSWLVDGQCDFYTFLEHLDMEELAAQNDYNTLSGLILDKLEHVPITGEKMEWQGLLFEVVDMDVARIDKVLVSRVAA